MPSLERLHQEFKDNDFTLLGIDMQESRDRVRKFVRKNGLTFTNLLDTDGTVSALFGVSSTPVKFLIDSDGNMVGAALGYRDWDRGEFRSLIQLLIKKRV